MRFLMRYHVKNAGALRKRFRAMMRENDQPMLICANHLTMVDSAVVAWALGGSWWYVFNYSRMPWNLPEYTNYAFVWPGRFGAWLTKCIPVRRGGRRQDVSGVIKRVQHLVTRGETALIFPEAGRSRTGRVQSDSIAHGVGRILNSVRDCRALCVYIRGDRQKTWVYRSGPRRLVLRRLRALQARVGAFGPAAFQGPGGADSRSPRPYGAEIFCSSVTISSISTIRGANPARSTAASTAGRLLPPNKPASAGAAPRINSDGLSGRLRKAPSRSPGSSTARYGSSRGDSPSGCSTTPGPR